MPRAEQADQPSTAEAGSTVVVETATGSPGSYTTTAITVSAGEWASWWQKARVAFQRDRRSKPCVASARTSGARRQARRRGAGRPAHRRTNSGSGPSSGDADDPEPAEGRRRHLELVRPPASASLCAPLST